MANETSTTTLATLLPNIIREALFVASQGSIMRGLVKNYSVPMGTGKTVNVPIYPSLTAAAVAELTDLGNTAVTTGEATLTISEVGLMTTVTDIAVATSADNVVASIGKQFGEAIACKMDQDLTALFAGFSDVLGSDTTVLTAAHIFQAVAKLRARGITGAELFCVLNPEVAYDLKSNLTNTFANPNAGNTQNEAMLSGYVGMLAGVPIYETSHVVSTAGDSIGGLFHRDALGLALMKDFSLELQRDASLRATELVGTAVYGVGELFDTYGVAMSFDSSIV